MTVSRTWPTGSDDGRPGKGVNEALSEKEKKIIKALDENISKMSDAEKMYLLGRIEGMAYAANRNGSNKEE